MRYTVILAGLVGAALTSALESPHRHALPKAQKKAAILTKDAPHKRSVPAHLNSKTEKFYVNGSTIPDVDFNIGESYAGILSVDSNSSNQNALWFWYFPSENPAASEEITIWLNGGPGCSSLNGLLEENGPFLWQDGTYSPIPNPYSWVSLTNTVWIDQPIGTGFSPAAAGAPSQIGSEEDVARDFMGFWKNFMDTFDLKDRKVYLTGESYAGQYIPYIASAMLNAKNTEFYDVAGIQIIDPSINEDDTLIQAPAVMALNHFSSIFNLNDTFMADIQARADACGYIEFMENALVFPPKGPIPAAPDSGRSGCDVWEDIKWAAYVVNPCFNIYHILDYCPFLWDQLGFNPFEWGPSNYFNRTDVQEAIHAPPTDYTVCGDYSLFPDGDRSPPSGLGPLPSVIERTNNVIIAHGLLDFLLIANGSLVTIQNMTWNGKQGFQTAPPNELNFYVPYNEVPMWPLYDFAGSGLLGVTHTERGLTWVTVNTAGHMIPQYAPGAAYRQLEFLLGRISSLEQTGAFMTQTGDLAGTRSPPV